METTFEFCALQYFEIWYQNDKPAHTAFENNFKDRMIGKILQVL